MSTEIPRIAIPEPTSNDAPYNQRSLPQYARAIEAAGGVAVLLALNSAPEQNAALLATCSGILLPGSPADVDPRRYGQTPVKACASKDAAREAVDNLLLQDAFENGKPFLGICFGLQSLNVWRNGTLIQDLPTRPGSAGGAIDHAPGRDVLHAHEVVVKHDSHLASIVRTVGRSENDFALQVNSSHHQAIGEPGDSLQVVARSPQDDVIEALETAEPGRFLVAVQWHPERDYEQSAASRALFTAFLDAANTWQARKQAKEAYTS